MRMIQRHFCQIGTADIMAKRTLLPCQKTRIRFRRCLPMQTNMTFVVPQGGNTGFMGGATPDASGHTILLSLRRMNKIRQIDKQNMSMTVEAGCILQTFRTRRVMLVFIFRLI